MHIREQAWQSYGGLGPNLPANELNEKLFLSQKARDFSDKLRSGNRARILSDVNRAKPTEVPRAVSTRDRALEFAQRIPKPVKHSRSVTTERPEEVAVPNRNIPEDRLISMLHQYDKLAEAVKVIVSKHALQHETI